MNHTLLPTTTAATANTSRFYQLRTSHLVVGWLCIFVLVFFLQLSWRFSANPPASREDESNARTEVLSPFKLTHSFLGKWRQNNNRPIYVFWEGDADQFERNPIAKMSLESLILMNPQSPLILLSDTFRTDYFDMYNKMGYHVSKSRLYY